MRKISLGKDVLMVYETIKELPVKRYNKFQSYLMLDSGIGSTMADVDRRFTNLDTFLSAGKLKEAAEERNNLHYAIYSNINGINYKSLSFGCMIHSFKGKPVTDLEESSLMELLNKLSDSGLTQMMVQEQIDDLKKNFNLN